jgi:hypothetical protein
MAMIMNMDLFSKGLIDEVKKQHGMKTSDLVARTENKHGVARDEIEKLIHVLVAEHKLIEIEYSFDMATINGFLLPPSTKVNVRGVPPSPPRRI